MRFLFVGNRRFVLEEIRNRSLPLASTLVIKNSHLEKDLKNQSVPHDTISGKKELLCKIEETEFDVLVSNGCPYILPICKMKPKLYVNIHPSCLPDLKGVDPVIGSILYKRDSGATCHLMDDTIDGGPIISQVRIPYTKELDVSLLYQLSFMAEKQVFVEALERGFIASRRQEDSADAIYYTRQARDQQILFSEPVDLVLQKIRAFNNRSQGCVFFHAGTSFRVYDGDVLTNPYLLQMSHGFADLQIMLRYEESIVFKKDNHVVRFGPIAGDRSLLSVGAFLEKTQA